MKTVEEIVAHRREQWRKARTKWRKAHPERAQASNRKQRNKVGAIEARRRYHAKNRAKANEYALAYYHKNKEEIGARKKFLRSLPGPRRDKELAYGRAYNKSPKRKEVDKRYFDKNRDRRVQELKNWAKDNPDKFRLAKNRAEHNRRAKKKGAPGYCSNEQLLARIEFHQWRCVYCGRKLTFATLTVDHRIHLAKGGTNWPANLVPACGPCNSTKSDMSAKEFLALR